MIELRNVLSQIYKASELILKASKNTKEIGLSFETSCHYRKISTFENKSIETLNMSFNVYVVF
jgi:hypothetical protein